MKHDKYVVTFGDHKETVEAWSFEVDNETALFYDNRGELVAAFVGYSAVVKHAAPSDKPI